MPVPDRAPPIAGTGARSAHDAPPPETFLPLREQLPVLGHLIDARRAADAVLRDDRETNPVLASTLDAVVQWSAVVARLFEQLREAAPSLLNLIRCLDNSGSDSSAYGETTGARAVRQHLWDAMQALTNSEFVEFAPPARERLGAWVEKQSWRLPIYEYLEVETAASPGETGVRDEVLAVLRPGILRQTKDAQTVVQKARVRIAGRPATIPRVQPPVAPAATDVPVADELPTDPELGREEAHNPEDVRALCATYPVFNYLIDAHRAARFVIKEFPDLDATNHTLYAALERVGRQRSALASEVVNLPDSAQEVDRLKQGSGPFLNLIKEFDAWAAKNVTHAVWPRIRAVRQYLWDFLREVWGGEYVEFKPTERERILTWFMKQKWPRALAEYLEIEKVALSGRGYVKDEVIKVLRPGILRKKPDNAHEIIQKALVQIV